MKTIRFAGHAGAGSSGQQRWRGPMYPREKQAQRFQAERTGAETQHRLYPQSPYDHMDSSLPTAARWQYLTTDSFSSL